ncbi:hypothetical protein ACIF80_13570 [Streptomyces sp. NPDC085927]|uniref:hypothetical protein n=1 Tax=Streptomyces sp. NPDC085927 TaxID=3365738 RepID=UPI0037D22A2B
MTEQFRVEDLSPAFAPESVKPAARFPVQSWTNHHRSALAPLADTGIGRNRFDG